MGKRILIYKFFGILCMHTYDLTIVNIPQEQNRFTHYLLKKGWLKCNKPSWAQNRSLSEKRVMCKAATNI